MHRVYRVQRYHFTPVGDQPFWDGSFWQVGRVQKHTSSCLHSLQTAPCCTCLLSTMRTFTAIAFLLGFSIDLVSAAHAGFHVQFPWTSRGPSPKTRSGIDQFNPFCGMFPAVCSPAASKRWLIQTRRDNPQPANIRPPVPQFPLVLWPPWRPYHGPLYPQ